MDTWSEDTGTGWVFRSLSEMWAVRISVAVSCHLRDEWTLNCHQLNHTLLHAFLTKSAIILHCLNWSHHQWIYQTFLAILYTKDFVHIDGVNVLSVDKSIHSQQATECSQLHRLYFFSAHSTAASQYAMTTATVGHLRPSLRHPWHCRRKKKTFSLAKPGNGNIVFSHSCSQARRQDCKSRTATWISRF